MKGEEIPHDSELDSVSDMNDFYYLSADQYMGTIHFIKQKIYSMRQVKFKT